MPINPDDYPLDWTDFSKKIRFHRAGGHCECLGECGVEHGGGPLFGGSAMRCGKKHGDEVGGKRVVLTVAHLNADTGPCSCDPLCAIAEHVKAMCQACHLRYDRDRHARSRAQKGR